MLLLGSLISLLFVGLAVDVTAMTRSPGGEGEPDPPEDPDPDRPGGLVLEGSEGPDWLAGTDGDDLLIGSAHPDRAWLHGGAGNDTLHPGIGDFAEGGEGEDLFLLDALGEELQVPGEQVPIIADFDALQDRIELRYQEAGHGAPPLLTLERDADGSAMIRLDGVAVGRVLQAAGLRAADIALTRIDPGA